jgi:hypothetical protein
MLQSDLVDVLVLAILAIGDLALLIHLRRARSRRMRERRMMRCLVLAGSRTLRRAG